MAIIFHYWQSCVLYHSPLNFALNLQHLSSTLEHCIVKRCFSVVAFCSWTRLICAVVFMNDATVQRVRLLGRRPLPATSSLVSVGFGQKSERSDWMLMTFWTRTDPAATRYTGRAKKIKLANIWWQSYKQERGCIVHFLHRLAGCWQARKVHEVTTLLLVTLPNVHWF